MPRFYRFAALLLLSACTLEQQNGDLRVIPAPIIEPSTWHISQQTNDGIRTCTVSGGELDVTLRKGPQGVATQVATRAHLSPGDYYQIIMQGHVYETQTPVYGAADSKAIVADLLTHDVVYTEQREQVIEGRLGDRRMSWTNKIDLSSFPELWHNCQAYTGS